MDNNTNGIFGDAFTTALKQQVTADSAVFMPDERETTFRGNIGWALARNMFRLYTASALAEFELQTTMEEGDDSYKGVVEFNGKTYPITTTMAGGTFVRFDDVMIAGALREHIIDNDGSGWVFSERELVIPFDKMVYWGNDKFRDIVKERGGDLISSVGMTGMSGWKRGFRNFVAMHLLYLPSAVAAMMKWGQRGGMIDASVNIDEVWSAAPIWTVAQFDDEKIMFFSPEAQREVIGDEDGFQESTMFQQRAALWKLLGENNPLAYLPDKKTGKYAMESDALRNIIKTVMGVWKEPALLAINNVSLPISDLTDGQGRPIRQDIIVDWFSTEKEAKKFTSEDSSLTVTPQTNKSLPDSWTGMEREWKTAIEDVKTRFDSPDKVPQDTLDLLEATVEHLADWW